MLEHFQQFGSVVSVEMKRKEDGTFRGFGFVTFADQSGADYCVALGANHIFLGKQIECQPATITDTWKQRQQETAIRSFEPGADFGPVREKGVEKGCKHIKKTCFIAFQMYVC